jgi:cell wall-associated NlpC family hydrolase
MISFHPIVCLESYNVNADENYIRSCVTTMAANYLNIKYQWGGLSPEQGLDCSGLVYEVLTSLGFRFPTVSSSGQLRRSQYLYEVLKAYKRGQIIRPGDLLWFGKSVNEITHVSIAISSILMIEAGGEGRESTDKGSVRIRPIRSDLVAFRSPVEHLVDSIKKREVNYANVK